MRLAAGTGLIHDYYREATLPVLLPWMGLAHRTAYFTPKCSVADRMQLQNVTGCFLECASIYLTSVIAVLLRFAGNLCRSSFVMRMKDFSIGVCHESRDRYMRKAFFSRQVLLSDTAIIVYFALLKLAIHMFTNSQYGFFMDELAFIDDGKHLAWGYVDHPPLTPFLVSVAHLLFGDSIVGYRLLSALAGVGIVALTGLMVKELGGGRFARMLAMGAVIIAPFYLGSETLLHVIPFDQLIWVLCSYLLIKLLRTGDARWWLAIGTALGLGMMNKYTIVFFMVGLATGLLLTPNRKYLTSKWLWLGALIAVLIWLPNAYWQITHNWISLTYLQSIHARDVLGGRSSVFMLDQLFTNVNPVAAPIWLAGLHFCLFSKRGQPYRMLGWLYIGTFTVLVALQGVSYYLAPMYPLLLAAGAFAIETLIREHQWTRVKPALAGLFVVTGIVIAPICLPITAVASPLWNLADRINFTFRGMLGWDDLAETVANVYRALPVEQQTRTAILAGHYGEAGAINLYGPAYGLPPAISGINTYYYWSKGNTAADTYIVVGHSKQALNRMFQDVSRVGDITNRYGVETGETMNNDHGAIYLCRNPRMPFEQMWSQQQHFG
jgi:hypothetical protein